VVARVCGMDCAAIQMKFECGRKALGRSLAGGCIGARRGQRTRHLTASEKVKLIRRHLIEKTRYPPSATRRNGAERVSPWQEQLFLNAALAWMVPGGRIAARIGSASRNWN